MNDEINNFVKEYRDSLGITRDASMQALDVAKNNYFQNAMANANTSGMMYSNFPERAKYQYMASTYLPKKAEIQSTYQTGLDKLRSNVTSYLNQLAELKEATADLNKASGTNKFAINDAGDYSYNYKGGTQFRDVNGNPIRFGTAAKRAGKSSVSDILGYASGKLYDDELERLNNIWETARQNGATGFQYNVGDEFVMPSWGYLSTEDNDFLGSLGLTFAQ